ncbi:TerB family tellurite resistance protein [Xanthomonas axonopodis]
MGTTEGMSPEQRIAELQARLEALEKELGSLPDDALGDASTEHVSADDRDASNRDWAACEHGPNFDTGDACIPIRIQYRDSNGDVTSRKITVERYRYGESGGTISAHCGLRGERRTFLFHRIEAVYDPVTGESIEDLWSWLDLSYSASPQGRAQGIIDAHADAITALFYLAKADGALRSKERQAIVEFLAGQGVALTDAAAVVAVVAKWIPVSAVGYGKTLAGLHVKDTDYRGSMVKAALSIVNSDSQIYPQEARGLKRLIDALATD